MAELFEIAEASGEKRANAVFFHGLGGDARGTWCAGPDKASFWPAWLAQDLQGLSVYSVGYEAPVSRWRGSAMHLTDRATNVLARLLVEPGLASGTLVFIGHSLGGLLIKQILRTAQSEAQNDEKAANFLRRVEKIAFLATPHTGADLAVWGDRLRILVRPSAATGSLVRNDPNLRDLNLWYRDWANHQNIANLILTETKPLRILGTIVKPDSADPGLSGARPRPMDYDHEWISKPLDKTSDIYVQILAFIKLPVERPKDPIAEKLDKLEAQQKELTVQVAREKGVDAAPLRTVLVKLGEAGVKDEDIPKRLEEKADELVKLRAKVDALQQGSPGLAAIAQEAQALIATGDLDGASHALAARREVSRTRQIDSSREDAEILALEAGVDDLQLAYRAAATKYAEAAGLIAPFDTEQQWRFLLDHAGELFKQGDEFGDNAALTEAIGVYRRCLALAPRSERPLDWAATQGNLGNALRTLGERESGTARLMEAVAVFREALQEFTRARAPLEWAKTQVSLGAALETLGERESGTARLTEAVSAYREALQENTRERVPLQWAMTQMNLGNALSALGERESGTERLEEAVAAYREALLENTRARVLLQWAMTQMNLGNALTTLGERESGTARLEEAVAAYREALQERTRARVPLKWAITQLNLGNALRTLGERESGTARLEEAVAASREALQELTPARAPLQWATTQMNLGNALSSLGERESGTARLEEAFVAYSEALQENTRARVPLDWAGTQMNLALVYCALFDKDHQPRHLDDALEAADGALEEFRPANAAFFIDKAERLRENIVAAKGKL